MFLVSGTLHLWAPKVVSLRSGKPAIASELRLSPITIGHLTSNAKSGKVDVAHTLATSFSFMLNEFYKDSRSVEASTVFGAEMEEAFKVIKRRNLMVGSFGHAVPISIDSSLPPSSSVGALSSEKSTPNPHAEDFKFNPNIKSFIPPKRPPVVFNPQTASISFWHPETTWQNSQWRNCTPKRWSQSRHFQAWSSFMEELQQIKMLKAE